MTVASSSNVNLALRHEFFQKLTESWYVDIHIIIDMAIPTVRKQKIYTGQLIITTWCL